MHMAYWLLTYQAWVKQATSLQLKEESSFFILITNVDYEEKRMLLCEAWGSHGGNYEDYCLTGCDAM
jgi:hypothetical protein